jgi:hypothetical protein
MRQAFPSLDYLPKAERWAAIRAIVARRREAEPRPLQLLRAYRRLRSLVVADFLNLIPRTDLAIKYKQNMTAISRMVRELTTQKQRRDVRRYHHREYERAYFRRTHAGAETKTKRHTIPVGKFPSVNAAARAINIPHSTAHKLFSRGVPVEQWGEMATAGI